MCWEPQHRNARCDRLATASKDKGCRVWNVRTMKCELHITGHTDSVECVRWGGEGLLYTGSRDRTIKVWAVEAPHVSGGKAKLVRTLQGHAHRINALALSCDYACRSGAFDHTGTRPADAAAAQAKALARYREARGGRPERLVSCSDDFTLFLWEPAVGKRPVTRMTGHQQLVNHILFSPDGRFVASASFDKKVKVWDGYTGQFLATLTGHVAAVYRVCWSPDSRYLVSASKDSTLKLWDAPVSNRGGGGKRSERTQKGRARGTLPGHADEVYALDWSPNGQIVASGGKDRVVKIWHN